MPHSPRPGNGSALGTPQFPTEGEGMVPVRFARAAFFGSEQQSMEAVQRTGFLPGATPFPERCTERLEQHFLGAKVLLTHSCTAALEICGLLLDLGPEDEVILPSFTFVATASAFALRGCRLRFADTDPATLGPSLKSIRALLGPRTKAVVTMHYGLAGPDLVELAQLCRERGVVLIEDNAHGMLAELEGRPLGTLGSLTATSFHYTKSVSCGQGGALVIRDPALVERAIRIHERGTNQDEFRRGRVDAYRWVEHGSSFALSDLAAACLWGQLEAMDRIRDRRGALERRYRQELADWSESSGIRLGPLPEGATSGSSPFPLIAPSRAGRDALGRHLGARGIEAPFHYQPLHASPMGQSFGAQPGDCPVATRLGQGVLRLPMHNALTEPEIERVIEAVRAFDGSSAAG